MTEHIFIQWEDDSWIVEAKNYQPYFVVDGQQRLTTAIVLIQTILEHLPLDGKLNYTERSDIQRKFIFDSKDDGISRSYIFGYEKDNPSYEFLKSKVFGERSSSGTMQETIYTQNLAQAKRFFVERVNTLSHIDLEILYRKVTQNLLFNIFTISEEVDTCVAFETMNNRGKPLSYLELLKNRLIYLSLKFDEPEFERNKLRRSINDCWKAIYHSLGKNKDKPLDDDKFLLTHYHIYFGKASYDEPEIVDDPRYRRLNRANYANTLLEKIFITKNVSREAADEVRITLGSIYQYVSSLQDSVETWYKLFNPLDSDFFPETQVWLDKLNRIGMDFYLPLILVYMQKVTAENKRLAFLQAIERHLFVLSLLGRYFRQYFSPGYPHKIPDLAIDLYTDKINADKITRHITDETSSLLKAPEFIKEIKDWFRSNGFYEWVAIRYFLFEYNTDLQARSKTERAKIFWSEFTEHKEDFISVEHIFPQQARHEYWTSRFTGLSHKQRTVLRNHLVTFSPFQSQKIPAYRTNHSLTKCPV